MTCQKTIFVFVELIVTKVISLSTNIPNLDTKVRFASVEKEEIERNFLM